MGHEEHLVAAHPGNTNALRHGAYSRRALLPRAQEVAAALLQVPGAVELDALAAEEVGSLVAMVEALDAELAKRKPGAKGTATLYDLRLRASGRLQRWLAEFGATPASRAALAQVVASGNLAAEI